MAQVIVRNLDDEVVVVAEVQGRAPRALARAGAARHPEAGGRADAEEKLALIERIRAKQERRLEDDSTDLIRADRDSR